MPRMMVKFWHLPASCLYSMSLSSSSVVCSSPLMMMSSACVMVCSRYMLVASVLCLTVTCFSGGCSFVL